MSDDSLHQSRPELSAAALDEWNGLVEGVLRGIAHTLNNRAAALSAVVELSRDPDESPVVGSILTAELARVGELVRAVRSLAASRSGIDAFTAKDAATEAVAVLNLHTDWRERRLAIDVAGAAALRGERWMFVRALIAMGSHALPVEGVTTLTIAEDGEWLVACLAEGSAPQTALTPLVCELASAMEGEPLPRRDGYGFRVPTLTVLRRREGRAV